MTDPRQMHAPASSAPTGKPDATCCREAEQDCCREETLQSAVDGALGPDASLEHLFDRLEKAK